MKNIACVLVNLVCTRTQVKTDLVYPTFKSKSTFHLKKKIEIIRCKVNDDHRFTNYGFKFLESYVLIWNGLGDASNMHLKMSTNGPLEFYSL